MPETEIILCHDGSEHSLRAMEAAARLLPATKAVLLHVRRMPSPARLSTLSYSYDESVIEAGAGHARRLGFDVEVLTPDASGPEWRTIVDVAYGREAAAIVVGSRGRSTTRSMLLGSTSYGVVHHARQPVLVVPPAWTSEAHPEGEHGAVLFAHDGTEESLEAITTAGALLRTRDGIVLGVVDGLSGPVRMYDSQGRPLGFAERARERKRFNELLKEEALPGVESAAEALRERGWHVAAEVEETFGALWGPIVARADDPEIAAIALGARGKSMLDSMVLGSVSNGVVHHTSKPVLVVRRSDS